MLSYFLWFAEFTEIVFGISMFFNAALFIPQAIKIYRTKTTKGLSPATFIGFNIIQIFTILHGYIHQDYLLMFGFILSLVSCGIVTFLIFLYRE
ncbi:MAG: hypothetical protein LBQ08_03620 [Holosporaceae bacterium]|nr:hypothetical protein [Holosporaceae bacterium]